MTMNIVYIEEMYIKPLHEPITAHFIDKCSTNSVDVDVSIASMQWNGYLRAIIDIKGKQVIRFGDNVDMYPDIPECTVIRYKGRNHIDDGTFQNEKIPPIPITSDHQDIDFHATSFFLGIVITLMLIFVVWGLRYILQKRKKYSQK